MKTSSIALIIGSLIAGGLLLVTLVLGGYTLSLYNSEGTLHNLYDAKIKANSAIFDNTWKEISQTAQVPEAQKAAFSWDVYRFPIPEPPYSMRTRLATFAYKAHATRFVRMLKGKMVA